MIVQIVPSSAGESCSTCWNPSVKVWFNLAHNANLKQSNPASLVITGLSRL